jgi:hypothetical protein
MKLIGIILALLASTSFASESRHMISVGPQGLGWSGAAEKIDGSSSSEFKHSDYFLHQLALNYAYRLFPRIQLGGFYKSSTSEYRFKRRDGKTTPVEIEENTFGFFALYNFNEELNKAWYLGYALSMTNHEEENDHEFTASENKAPFELDDLSQTHEVILGKRFEMRWLETKKIVYSPQGSAFIRKHSKDFKDQKTKNGRGVSLMPIRFDILF